MYLVHPLPETMTEYVWDIGSLKEKEELQYIERMMSILIVVNLKFISYFILTDIDVNLPIGKAATNPQFQQNFSRAILDSHNLIRKITNEPSSVSLRDVARCLKMNQFFHKHYHMQRERTDAGGDGSRGSKHLPLLNDHAVASHSMLLALAHCYYYRLSKKNRDKYITLLSRYVRETPKGVSKSPFFFLFWIYYF